MNEDSQTPRQFTRRRVLTLAGAATTIGLTANCMSRAHVPRERSVSFGFEDVVTEKPRWRYYGDQLHRVNANAMSISVGRADWTAFPWASHPTATASKVSKTGTDYVAETIDALRPRLSGDQQLTLTIDTLAPARLKATPTFAGVNPQGKKADSFPSVSALSTGPVGDRIVELTSDVCSRYNPDRVSITELMFDDYTFGKEDLNSYRNHTGEAGWPRTASGEIDTEDPSLGIWRSDALAELLSRIKAAASVHGARLDMDVRTSWSKPGGDRALSGHSYDVMLEEADRIVVWNYFAINGSTPEYGAKIVDALKGRVQGRFVMSTGLWADEGVISSEELEASLTALARSNVDAVSVTPASLMTERHWAALEKLWKV